MKAYKIAMFLILFNLALPVASQIPVVSSPISKITMDTVLLGGMSGIGTLVSTAVGAIGLAGSLIFRLPVGAAVFAATFTASNIGANTILNRMVQLGYMNGEMKSMLSIGIAVVFLFAFIQLASTGGRGAH